MSREKSLENTNSIGIEIKPQAGCPRVCVPISGKGKGYYSFPNFEGRKVRSSGKPQKIKVAKTEERALFNISVSLFFPGINNIQIILM